MPGESRAAPLRIYGEALWMPELGLTGVMPTGGAKDVRVFRRCMSNCEQLAVRGLFDADAVVALRPGEEAYEAGASAAPRRAKHKEDETMGIDWTDPRDRKSTRLNSSHLGIS